MPRLYASWWLAVLLAGTTGCGLIPTGDAGKPAAVKPADYAELVHDAPLSATVDGGLQPDEGRAWLVAPHYRVEFDWVAATDRLDGESALAVGSDSPVRAADGHELVLGSLGSSPAIPPWDDPKAKVTAAVAVGERTVELDTPPAAGDMVVVSAPKGAPVSLRITDAGRTFGYDLRAGQPYDGQYWWRSGDNSVSYKGSGSLVVAPRSRTMEVSIRLGDLHLGPWTPSKGWSKPGRAWLLLTDVTASSTSLSFDFDKEFPCTFSLDTAKTFTVTLPNGQKMKPVRARIEAVVGTNAITGVTVLFDVPATFRSGTLRLTPDGPITANFRDGDIPLRWNRPPPPKTLPLSI